METPQSLMTAANVLAQQCLGMPADIENMTLTELKTLNPVMHALVTARIGEIRRSCGGDDRWPTGNGRDPQFD